jgi:hypothetical protein
MKPSLAEQALLSPEEKNNNNNKNPTNNELPSLFCGTPSD